jgi:GNAT superfamily N-acetyltransferase
MKRIELCPPPDELAADQPDAHMVLGDARCSLWWHSTPEHAGRRVGAIGHFSARGAESGAELLQAACRRLASEGCRLAIGPMDGNTWRRYRLVIEGGDEPPFFLEPANPAHWPTCFSRAGFSVAATYCSSMQEDLGFHDDRLTALARRAAEAGIRIRALEPRSAERDLCDIHAVALCAFRDSFLFSPIDKTQFLAQYSRLLPCVRPELVLIAEHGAEPVAFLFGLPDALEAGRGAAPSTAILKTIAARPGRAYAGIARLLVARGAQAAAELGYRRAVHALMHEANSSLGWSARHGRVFRRYALFGRTL